MTLLRQEWMWGAILEDAHCANKGRAGHKGPEVAWAASLAAEELRKADSLAKCTPLSDIYTGMCWVSGTSQDKEVVEERVAYQGGWIMKLDASQATKSNKDGREARNPSGTQ